MGLVGGGGGLPTAWLTATWCAVVLVGCQAEVASNAAKASGATEKAFREIKDEVSPRGVGSVLRAYHRADGAHVWPGGASSGGSGVVVGWVGGRHRVRLSTTTFLHRDALGSGGAPQLKGFTDMTAALTQGHDEAAQVLSVRLDALAARTGQSLSSVRSKITAQRRQMATGGPVLMLPTQCVGVGACRT